MHEEVDPTPAAVNVIKGSLSIFLSCLGEIWQETRLPINVKGWEIAATISGDQIFQSWFSCSSASGISHSYWWLWVIMPS